MNPRMILRTVLLSVGLVAGGAVAMAPATASAAVPSVGKVAMVDMQKVLNDTVAGKRARKELEASSSAKQKKLDKKRAQLEKDAAKLRSLSGAQLAAAQEKLQKESVNLQTVLMTFEQELATSTTSSSRRCTRMPSRSWPTSPRRRASTSSWSATR